MHSNSSYNYVLFCKILHCVSRISVVCSDSAGRDLLDCTRIHPETYEWARKMAVDALEYDEVYFYLPFVRQYVACAVHVRILIRLRVYKMDSQHSSFYHYYC